MDAIRPATEQDAAAVAALWTEAYVTFGVGGRSVPYGPGDALETLEGGELYVWPGPSAILGVVALRPPGSRLLAVARGGEAELCRLAVARTARGRGIGRALAQLCGERASASGRPAIALWSRSAQTEAHRLYESLGYLRAPERDSVDGSGQARIVFRLPLQPRPAAVPYPPHGRIRNSQRMGGG
jgi:ribosomal protein S18 acetylase RimI-like enzyme